MEKHFILPDTAFDNAFHKEGCAPLFRKTFWIEKPFFEARIAICALGFGYCYINGKRVSEDLFTAPVSNYADTLWYLTYDVTKYLCQGKNTIAVICGNGWFNESFRTVWYPQGHRNLPRVSLTLTLDREEALVTDGTWRCRPYSFVRFNQLRSGEWFDATLYDPAWKDPDYPDESWCCAKEDPAPPSGILRECLCEPIREFEVIGVKEVRRTGERKFVFDMGINRSGYIRLTATGKKGQLLTIRYGESLKPDHSLYRDNLSRFYPESEFMTDRFTCSGEKTVWSPMFTYHGFRYIEIEGIDSPEEVTVEAVFVHQCVEKRTFFRCSEDFLNRLFAAGQNSCLSNLFYCMTDCPSREKFGWTDDAQMSAEQMFTDFKIEKLCRKWLQGIRDTMKEDGSLPGVVPSNGYGYTWGNGPLSDGVLFEIPYRIYLHTGNPDALIENLPWFIRYLNHLKTKENEEGFVTFGLGDWAVTADRDDSIPTAFTNGVLIEKFYRITELAQTLAKDPDGAAASHAEALRWKEKIMKKFIGPDGRCTLHKISPVAVLIRHGILRDLSPLKEQLKQLVEENEFRHNSGILGTRCLYEALNLCGLQEYAYRILTVRGYPGYRYWLENGATTLLEYFHLPAPEAEYQSENHHMYSDFMSWLIKTVLGIRHDKTDPERPEFTLDPYYFSELTFAEGSYESDNGKLTVRWDKKDNKVLLQFTVTGDTSVLCRGTVFPAGEYRLEETISD